jgi:hypothetical protein
MPLSRKEEDYGYIMQIIQKERSKYNNNGLGSKGGTKIQLLASIGIDLTKSDDELRKEFDNGSVIVDCSS